MARISDLLSASSTLSFEFFPPTSPKASQALSNTLESLVPLNPDFVSVTYGAAGNDRSRTGDLVADIVADHKVPTMAHLTCIGHSVAEIDTLLDRYAAMGVSDILALAGDPPSDGSRPPSGDFVYASELVQHIAADGRFGIGVAAHPEGHPRSSDMATDRAHLAEKLLIADFAITQFFFNAADYFKMVADLADLGCDTPVIPGVIPITNLSQIERFAAMAGATVPSRVRDRLGAVADDPSAVFAVGVEIASELSRELLDGKAPGIHLYTLNKSAATTAVLDNLGSLVA